MITIPDRIYAQYRNKPKAVAWYNITPEMAQDLISAAEIVKNMYSIDDMEGAQLDIIGRIVDIDRSYIIPVSMPLAMCASSGNAPAQCGDSSGAQASALYSDSDDKVNDELFRLIIKAKIIKNNSTSTIEEILDGLNFILPDAGWFRLNDYENMSFSVEYYNQITDVQRYALLTAKLTPKPQGVKFAGYFEGFNYVQCGDSSRQCGDNTCQAVGLSGGY